MLSDVTEMLCNESNLSLEASGNETCKINEKFSLSVQGKSVEILPHIAECIVQVMWELLPSRTAVQHLVDISSWATGFYLLCMFWCVDNTCSNLARNETYMSGMKLYGQDWYRKVR